AIITAGDNTVQIDGSPSGFQAPYYRGSAEFLIRRQIEYRQQQGITLFRVVPDPVVETRTVRYVFLAGQDATYSGMARAYRQFLTTERGVQPVAQTRPALAVRLFMGVRQRVFFFNQLVTTTTFDEGRQVVEALRQRGM